MISGSIVLQIDSDSQGLSKLSSYLRSNGMQVSEAGDGLSGLREFFNVHPDIVVIDLDVGEMPAWQVISRIRELADTPVVVIASEATNEQVSKAFQLGVDGFLTRPFQPRELLERLTAIQNRSAGANDNRWVYKRNGLTVDLRSCEVFVRGERVSLTGTEYRLLAYLIEHRGWVLSHDQILTHVWGSDYLGERYQVKLYIWYLRRKIENDPKNPNLIVTKRGLGYTFVG
jgi:two-component system KDP operon response regulator KdpE